MGSSPAGGTNSPVVQWIEYDPAKVEIRARLPAGLQKNGRIVQRFRMPVLQTGGRWFESTCGYHCKINGFFLILKNHGNQKTRDHRGS